MRYHLFTLSLLIMLVSGCAMKPVPQTAAEHRVGIEPVVYQAGRSYSAVVKTLKQKTKECLDAKLIKQVCTKGSSNCLQTVVMYNPRMIVGKNESELHVQWKREPDNSVYLGGGKPPADGVYIFVFDIVPEGKSDTKVSVYGTTWSAYQTVPNAVKHWVQGTNLGCPDLTKPYYF